MARFVKEEDYNLRRKEILDAARLMVYTKGYEQMTIQDILDRLGISKGGFYHYFDSKQALLEALVEHMTDELLPILEPIVEDPHLNALEKFQRYFSTAASWKSGRKDFLINLVRVWYMDDNAIVREKMTGASIQRIAPMLTRITEQGMREGTLTTRYPQQVGAILLSLSQGMSETFANFLLTSSAASSPQAYQEAYNKLEMSLSAYADAFERILGAPPGSIPMFDPAYLRSWLAEPDQPLTE